jgi:hypothetical protein
VHAAVFLHVPKTAGMSFGQIVLRQFPRRARFQVDAADLASFEARWNELPADRRRGVRCIHGHVPFGVHAVLPEPVAYVTVLREPVDRIVSAYHYALRRPELPAHRALVEGRLSLHDYVTSELSDDVHDAQTRALAGGALASGAAASGPAGPEALARAVRNLAERFAVAGLCERFDESALVCRRVLGWSNVCYVERNRNRRRTPLADVPAPTVDAIRRRNPLDLELHATAAARFTELLRRDPVPAAELRAFRRRNRAYGLARRLVEVPLAIVRDARAASSRGPSPR